ncbi:hypothetical protein Bhyg_11781 [Pseudolycoriella hygida]|uniref:Uncharacterized protein n=1 Tax=Pseudolycoriella hygida TaxID=35572 RepID=A0A9Q0MYJ2_9DIPT|nr:hypothetical protein Bhyg_11781 [Pseudolycoriella hygida]
MVFIRKVFLLFCSLIFLTIVTSINCNKFNSKIDQIKRFPRQVNANNDQQIHANNSRWNEKEDLETSILHSDFDAHQGVKNVMHDKSSDRVISRRNSERRNRQLNIYSPGLQESNTYNYQEYMSQPWYLANKDYYDNYYANYYRSYYQTTTPQPTHHQYQQSNPNPVADTPLSQQQQRYPSQLTRTQSNQQSSPERLSTGLTASSALTSNDADGGGRIYIDENGLFQISKTGPSVPSSISSVIDDDAIVFQSDESQYDAGSYLSNDNTGKPSQSQNYVDSQSKPITFNGLPVFL